MEKLLTRAEVAEMLAVSEAFVRSSGIRVVSLSRRKQMYRKQDVEAWLESRRPAPIVAQTPRETWSLERPTVYFARMMVGAGIDPVKIGIATTVSERLAAFRTASPFEVRVILEIGGGAARERDLHERFRAHRLRGEWFRFAAEIADFVAASREEAKAFREGFPATNEEVVAASLGVSLREFRKLYLKKNADG